MDQGKSQHDGVVKDSVLLENSFPDAPPERSLPAIDMKQSARFPYNFVNFMALVVLLVFGIYAGAYWIGVALWEDEFDEDGQESGVDDGLPWTPFNALTVAQLGTVSSLFLWLTVCVTGLGSELVLGEWLVGKLSVGSGTVLWHGAQLLFSLCLSISLFAATPLALPFTVVGLWKFGYPETITAFRRAWLDGASIAGLQEFMNGMGVTLHHTSAVWLIVGMTTGLFTPRTREILACSLPLVGQHVGVLIKYHNLGIYVLINLILEIWWEWELFQQQQQLTRARGYHVSVHGTSLTMLFAHWLYWSAALLEIPKLVCVKTKEEHEVSDERSFDERTLARWKGTQAGWRALQKKHTVQYQIEENGVYAYAKMPSTSSLPSSCATIGSTALERARSSMQAPENEASISSVSGAGLERIEASMQASQLEASMSTTPHLTSTQI